LTPISAIAPSRWSRAILEQGEFAADVAPGARLADVGLTSTDMVHLDARR